MLSTIRWPGYLVLSLIILLSLLTPILGDWRPVGGLLYLIFYGLVLGNWLFIKNSFTCKLALGLLFLLMLAGLVLTAFFYCWQINSQSLSAALVLIPALLLPLIIKYPLIFESRPLNWKMDLKKWALLLIYLGLISYIFLIYFSSQTTAAIRTPWEVLPPEIFILYFLATVILLALLSISNNSFNLLLIILHALTTFSVSLIIYRLGFDYDPFIHRKNIELILANGTLLPKPFYYIGQYGLIIFLKQLLGLSVELLDKILVPLLAAVYLPTVIFFSCKENFQLKNRNLWLLMMTLLIFPCSLFIATTPQSLASLIFILTVLFTLYYLAFPKTTVWPLLIMGLFAVAIHPLSGLPLVFTIILILLSLKLAPKFSWPKLLHQAIIWEFFILGSLALPLAFVINSKTLSQLKVGFSLTGLFSLGRGFFENLSVFYRPFITIYDLVYSFKHNIIYLILFFAGWGVYAAYKNGYLKKYFIYLLAFAMIFINYYLLKTSISFFSLVDYERLSYPLRVLNLALFALLPFILAGAYILIEKIFKQSNGIILLFLLLLSAGLTLSFYLIYPRVDTITENHGYSTSLTDVKTVNFIEELQKQQPYIVLASQPVSAAAIKELGYKYYHNDYFFYPVPTGGKLYRLYEQLIYGEEPTADIIATVRYLTGVNDIYFVINSYWLDAKNRIDAEKEVADKWYAIDGKNYILKYND